jgi:hypothetical protein
MQYSLSCARYIHRVSLYYAFMVVPVAIIVVVGETLRDKHSSTTSGRQELS